MNILKHHRVLAATVVTLATGGIMWPPTAAATPAPPTGVAVSASARQAGLMQSAACSQWKVPKGSISQSNGYEVDLNPVQNQTTLTGIASSHLPAKPKTKQGPRPVDPPQVVSGGTIVDGSVIGNVVNFSVDWANNTYGRYEGAIDGAGFISGTAWDKKNPSSKATWYYMRDSRATCVKR
jgi:hypothetical protein